MKLTEVIGRSIKEIWVATKLVPGGLDSAEICIKLDNGKTIKFPWDLDVENIFKFIPKGAKNVLVNPQFKRIKNQKIDDVIVHTEEGGKTGFFELSNGTIIYESTMFFNGASGVGLQMFDSIKEFESEEGTNYKRLKKTKYMPTLYKTEEGKNEILHLYDEKLDELNIQYQYRVIDSSFGKTNIIVTGKSSNPPLIIIHGSNACAPISLETYPNLASQFQVFAIDVLAQPNKSAETRLSMKDDSYGIWLNEIIESLDLNEVTLVGFSFGGLVILKTLINNEDNIKEVFLSAPAYIVNGNPFKALFKVFIPMKRYMKTKRIKYVEKFLKELFTDKDEFAIKYLSKVFLNFEMDFTPVPVISKEEARRISTPITLIAAKKDIIFPGEKMLKRASKVFSSIKATLLLENSKHVQNKADNKRIEEMIMKE